MSRLRVALMGLGETSVPYLSAIESDDQLELVAAADPSAEVLRNVTLDDEICVYDDFRSLVVEMGHRGLDALFVAVPPYQSAGFLPLVAERHIPVFHSPPPARRVVDAVRLHDTFAGAKCPLVVARFWESEPAFSGLGNATETGSTTDRAGMTDLAGITDVAGMIRSAAASIWTTYTPDDWRGDQARAGGGVLLNSAYDAVDLLVTILGTPLSVFAQCSSVDRTGEAKRYDTEDVAVLALRFSDDRVASLTAMRRTARPLWSVSLMGTTATVALSPTSMTAHMHDGDNVKTCVAEQQQSLAPAIAAFATAIRSEATPPTSQIGEHIATLATIEAAYLSAKTGESESPRRLME